MDDLCVVGIWQDFDVTWRCFCSNTILSPPFILFCYLASASAATSPRPRPSRVPSFFGSLCLDFLSSCSLSMVLLAFWLRIGHVTTTIFFLVFFCVQFFYPFCKTGRQLIQKSYIKKVEENKHKILPLKSGRQQTQKSSIRCVVSPVIYAFRSARRDLCNGVLHSMIGACTRAGAQGGRAGALPPGPFGLPFVPVASRLL